MEELEIIATYDSEDTAESVTRALNQWFFWIMEGDRDETPELFEDFGLSTDDHAYDNDTDLFWEDTPRASVMGERVQVTIESDSGESLSLVSELLEALGAYEVSDGEDEAIAID